MAATSHDNFANARVVNISTYTTTQPQAGSFSTIDNTIEAGEPASGTSPVQYRSCWYKLLPTIKCNIVAQPTPGGSNAMLWSHVYQDSGGTGAAPANFAALQEIATSPADNVNAPAFTAKAGWTYIVRFVQHNTVNQNLTPKFVSSAPLSTIAAVPIVITAESMAPKVQAPRLQAVPLEFTLDLLATAPMRTVHAVPADITVQTVPAEIVQATIETLDLVPIDVVFQQMVPSLGVTVLDLDTPIDITFDTRAPTSVSSIRNIMSTPGVDARIPATRPSFVVALKRISGGIDDDVQVQVQYAATGDAIETGTLLTQDAPAATFTLLTLDATAAVLEGVYKWRSRIVVNGKAHDWLPLNLFTVEIASGDGNIPVTWDVHTSPFVPTPHVWYVDPASGKVGDTVTVVGQGLPASPVVKLGNVVMPAVSFTHVPATGQEQAVGRTEQDTEHDVITVLVPDVSAPGAGLVVQGTS